MLWRDREFAVDGSKTLHFFWSMQWCLFCGNISKLDILNLVLVLKLIYFLESGLIKLSDLSNNSFLVTSFRVVVG